MVTLVWELVGDGEGSLQPNQPGSTQLEDADCAAVCEGVDVVGTEEAVGGAVVVVTVTLTSSLQPNQPGVAQLVVV